MNTRQSRAIRLMHDLTSLIIADNWGESYEEIVSSLMHLSDDSGGDDNGDDSPVDVSSLSESGYAMYCEIIEDDEDEDEDDVHVQSVFASIPVHPVFPLVLIIARDHTEISGYVVTDGTHRAGDMIFVPDSVRYCNEIIRGCIARHYPVPPHGIRIRPVHIDLSPA